MGNSKYFIGYLLLVYLLLIFRPFNLCRDFKMVWRIRHGKVTLNTTSFFLSYSSGVVLLLPSRLIERIRPQSRNGTKPDNIQTTSRQLLQRQRRRHRRRIVAIPSILAAIPSVFGAVPSIVAATENILEERYQGIGEQRVCVWELYWW